MKEWKTVEKYQLWMKNESNVWVTLGFFDTKESALVEVNRSLHSRMDPNVPHIVIPITGTTYATV